MRCQQQPEEGRRHGELQYIENGQDSRRGRRSSRPLKEGTPPFLCPHQGQMKQQEQPDTEEGALEIGGPERRMN